ncbi:SpoIVB peptidase S55 [Silvibacterium sp.]|uniref:SpoIVB peptidase S55 n=1 Tax=Silvibacterium sp. TaxID=1964179 RepID=UPI0039E2F8E2
MYCLAPDLFRRTRCLIVLAALAAPALLPAETPAPPSSNAIFPLTQVHRGLHGTAWTVFEGTTPEPMDVEILGVLHNAIGPHQDMILARLHGTKPEYTGVVAGMSGSPVYIDGKLAGALAYRIGVFSKEPICGITPIEQMLQVRDENPAEAAPAAEEHTQTAAATGLTAAAAESAAADPTLASLGAGSSLIKPIDTPLIFSGFSPEALKLWKEHAPDMGLMPVAGIGGAGSAADDAKSENDPVIPGSAVSAILVRGDLDMAATCTVTYVDAKHLLACGHPITQFGPVSMPMTRADVVATLPSEYNAFKIVNTTSTIGSFTQDRETAIMGQFHLDARMIPMTVRIAQQGSAADAKTLHLEVVDQEQVTPSAVMVSVYQGLMESNRYASEMTYRIRAKVKLKDYPEVSFENLVAPTDLAPANLMAAVVLGQSFSKLYENAARRTPVEGITLDVEAIPGRRTIDIQQATIDATEVHAGSTITVQAALQPWRGEVRNVRIPVTLPAALPNGKVRLLVSDGATLDRLMQPPQFGGPELDIPATIAQLNAQHPSDRLYVTLLAPDPQVGVDGRTLTAVPLSLANALEPQKENHSASLNGESAVPLASVPVDAVLNGQQVIAIRVE